MTVVLGTLLKSMKQIKAPFVFDWEDGVALQAMQGTRALSFVTGRSHVFTRNGAEPGVHCRVMKGMDNQNSCLLRDDQTPL